VFEIPLVVMILDTVQLVSPGNLSVTILMSPSRQNLVGGVDVDGDEEEDGSEVGTRLVGGDVEDGIGLGAKDGRRIREGVGGAGNGGDVPRSGLFIDDFTMHSSTASWNSFLQHASADW